MYRDPIRHDALMTSTGKAIESRYYTHGGQR